MKSSHLGAALTFLFACSVGLPVARAETTVRIGATGCGALDVSEVERLLDFEISTVMVERKDAPPPTVELTCEGEQVRIVVVDPITSKKLERELPAPSTVLPGRERTLALAISQLFLTSWSELLLPPPKEPAAAPPMDRAGHVAAKRLVVKRVIPPTPALEMVLVGVGNARDLGQPFFSFGTSLRAGVVLDGRMRVFGEAGYELARATRSRGTVDVSLATIGAGLGFRSKRLGVVAFDVALSTMVVYGHIEGRAATSSIVESAGAGVGGALELRMGPTFFAGPLIVGLDIHAGALFPRFDGYVSSERAVTLGGASVGFGLTLGLGTGP